MKLEYYVMNYDWNKKRVEYFNIFRNCSLHDEVEKEILKYLKSPDEYEYKEFGCIFEDKTYTTGFDAFVRRLDRLIAWQERGRREYEISVADAFEKDINKLTKVDAYMQCYPNIEVIAREVLYQAEHQDEIKEREIDGLYIRDFRRV